MNNTQRIMNFMSRYHAVINCWLLMLTALWEALYATREPTVKLVEQIHNGQIHLLRYDTLRVISHVSSMMSSSYAHDAIIKTRDTWLAMQGSSFNCTIRRRRHCRSRKGNLHSHIKNHWWLQQQQQLNRIVAAFGSQIDRKSRMMHF